MNELQPPMLPQQMNSETSPDHKGSPVSAFASPSPRKEPAQTLPRRKRHWDPPWFELDIVASDSDPELEEHAFLEAARVPEKDEEEPTRGRCRTPRPQLFAPWKCSTSASSSCSSQSRRSTTTTTTTTTGASSSSSNSMEPPVRPLTPSDLPLRTYLQRLDLNHGRGLGPSTCVAADKQQSTTFFVFQHSHKTTRTPPPTPETDMTQFPAPLQPQPQSEDIRVAVGSLNKAKLQSVQQVVERLFVGKRVLVTGYAVASNVSNQPMSDAEAMDGAKERARNALRQDARATYAIGLEGGVQKIGDGWFESGWIAVMDRNGKVGMGSSGRFQLSQKIMARLLTGQEELAEVMDDLSGRVDVRSNDGAMGLLTNGHVPRDVAYAHGVYFAFAPFISNPVYWE